MHEDAKRRAAVAAIGELPDDGIIGLGSGSTAQLFIAALAGEVARGRRYTAVATSEASRAQAAELGIPLLPDDGPWDIAVTVDGADEVADSLDLIKGGGGAHSREKIVNASSRKNVIVIDAAKRSRQLGARFAVPIEVLAFAHRSTAGHLAAFGAPALRMAGGAPVTSDAGNLIYDLACGPIADPRALDAGLRAVPGVITTGLFVGRADVVLVAHADRVERLVRRG